MKSSSVAKAIGGLCLILAPMTAVSAQLWVPGSEITGQSVQIETSGVVNTVYFDPGGVARIATPSGNMVQGSWSVAANVVREWGRWPRMLALPVGVPGWQPVTLTSSCQVTSRGRQCGKYRAPQTPMGERG